MGSESPATARRLVLASAFIVLLFNSGARFAIGLLLPSMAQDLGWTRSTLALAVTVFMVVSAGTLPLVGRLVDRFGAHEVLLGSVIISSVGIAAMGLVETPAQALVVYGVVFALGSAGTSITPIGVLIRLWYPERVGMANSVAISGMGLGQLVVIAALSAELEVIGWRGSFVAVGIATAALALPPVLLAGGRAPPRENDKANPSPEIDGNVLEPARTHPELGAVLLSPRMWRLLVVYAICGFQDFLIATHVVAFALDEGVSYALAGNMLALMGLAGLAGVLLAGAMNDRRGPVAPTMLCFVIRVIIFAALLLDRSSVTIVSVALLYGSTFWMTAPLTVVFARGLAGLALLGTVSGFITMIHHASGGAGAFFAAAVFDVSGAYDVAFISMLVLSVVATALVPGLSAHRVPTASRG